jgi:hypothetical protein
MSIEIRQRGFGEILDAAFHLLRRDPALCTLLGALFTLPLALLQLAIPVPTATDTVGPEALPKLYASLAVSVVIVMIAGPIAYGSLTHANAERLTGREPDVWRSLRAACGRFPSLLWTWVLMILLAGLAGLAALALAVVVSGGLLTAATLVAGGSPMGEQVAGYVVVFIAALSVLVPMYWLLSRWALAVPVVALEGLSGRAALRRSRDLVRGYLRRMLGLFAAGWLITVVLTQVLQLGFGLVPIVGPVLTGLLGGVAVAFYTAIFTVLYYDMRCRKEDYDLTLMAAEVGAQTDDSPTPRAAIGG